MGATATSSPAGEHYIYRLYPITIIIASTGVVVDEVKEHLTSLLIEDDVGSPEKLDSHLIHLLISFTALPLM